MSDAPILKIEGLEAQVAEEDLLAKERPASLRAVPSDNGDARRA